MIPFASAEAGSWGQGDVRIRYRAGH